MMSASYQTRPLPANWRDTAERALILRREMHRRNCRRDLTAWSTEIAGRSGQTPAPHHRLLIKELQDVIQGRTPRLMINLPPGSAKSTYGSVIAPPWALAQLPGLDIIGASNTAAMAEGFSRRVMGVIRDNPDILG